SLVIFDVALVLGATAAAGLIWPVSGSALGPWPTIIAGIVWLGALAGIKGFATERLVKPFPMLSVWAGCAVVACFALIEVLFGSVVGLRQPVVLAIVLTVADVLGRAVIRRFHHPRVISVLPAHRYQ
ncbi:hypothetical protein JBE04_45595, partial [Streptomyces sp. PRKS01-29]